MVHHALLQHKTLKTCYFLRKNLQALSHLCGFGVRLSDSGGKNFCSDSFNDNQVGQTGQNDDSLLIFKDKIIRKHYWPTEQEAKTLQQLFPEPKKVIDDLFAPFQNAEENRLPKLEKKRQLGDNIYKTTLSLNWPIATNVCGKHKDESTSVLNAYLRACDFFKNIGLVQKQVSEKDMGSCVIENVTEILEQLASMQCSISGFHITNFRVINLLQKDENEEVFWTSSIQVLWPLSFTVDSKSTCLKAAYYETCLKTLLKFKACGYLDFDNKLNSKVLLSLERYGGTPFYIPHKRSLNNPDYELFVDASAYGFGAYLISNDDDKIRWLADRWVKDKIKFEPRKNSNLSEFYAFVSALYTWKHKFIDKKIIVYCDNDFVINIVNHGLYGTKHECYKLYLLLVKVCFKNNITVVGVHVPRMQNAAADLLSKYDVNSFKKILPTAYENPKKSKKLWFCDFNNVEKDDTETKDKDNDDVDDEISDDDDPKPSS